MASFAADLRIHREAVLLAVVGAVEHLRGFEQFVAAVAGDFGDRVAELVLLGGRHWLEVPSDSEGLLEIPLAYGRFLYLLPLDRSVAEHAGYTFARGQR